MSDGSLPIPSYGPQFQQVSLEMERFETLRRITEQFVMNAVELQSWKDYLKDDMVVAMTYHVFGQRLDEQTVEYPADWWQHFKQRWFPAWALRRWPVLNTVRTMKLMGFYPELLGRDRYLHVMVTP